MIFFLLKANLLNHNYNIQNENLNHDRKHNEEPKSYINKKSTKNGEHLDANSNQNLNNKFILNQINQEKQLNKKEAKKSPAQNQLFYNDVCNGSFSDLPNIDRNVLVNSNLSTYNVSLFKIS